MDRTSPTRSPSRRARITGWWLGGLATLFLAFDAGMKVVSATPALDASADLGIGPDLVPVIGAIQVGCLALLLVPRTRPLGAVLLTGYLGGAVATHLRLGSPLLSHTLFPVYVGLAIWIAAWLVDPRIRVALASRSS